VRLEIFGSADSIVVGSDSRSPLRSVEPGARPAGRAYQSFLDRFEHAYRAELETFVDTVIHGGTNEVMATIPLGKRPRGIRVSPDGTQLFVALSGSPIGGPNVDESKLPPPDKAADGIGIVDIATSKMVKMLHGGSDPESLSISADGTKVYASNEDAGGASIIDVATDTGSFCPCSRRRRPGSEDLKDAV
jgi:hypothetical protein